MFLILGLVVAIVAVAGRNAAAQEGGSGDANEVRNCVDLMRIDRTEIVDNDTILFYMRNGDVYRNDLQHQCPALGFEERFMYRTALTQLCDIDVITVLNDVGFGFMPGASCGLGKFQPIDEETAAQLLGRSDRSEAPQ